MTICERLRYWHLWPQTLASQLVVVTALAVLLSNAVVVTWFTFGNENDRDAAMSERLLDRAAATAALMREIQPNAREAALRVFSGNFWGSFALRHGKLDLPAMNEKEQKLTARLKTMLPESMAHLPVSVHVSTSLSGREANRPPPVGPRLQPFEGPPPQGEPRQSQPEGPPGAPMPRGPLPDAMPQAGQPPAGGSPMPAPRTGDRMFEVIIPISDDSHLVATFFRPPSPFWSAQLLIAALITAFVASLAAAYIARRVTRPMSKLAEAASMVARGGEAPKVPEEGPDDVRNAAVAFNAMYNQVTRTLESQRHLLSAVGHDLRTPITAMRINLEFVQDVELAERLKKNLDELQALTEAVLSAARGVSGEKMRQVDLSALVESVCSDLDDLGVPAAWQGGVAAPLMCRSNEIKRAARNLIENAVAYGKSAAVSVATDEAAYSITIDDEGPGIPEADRSRVFEPFVRLEGSRNEATGGVGLGLTLAKAIAESHGGHIRFEDREGGFRVQVVLPRL
jgi:signal transduction histidine kinase